jgi:4-amino-4-deoxy-L-arabinose transferase-like glycosyltransferase
MWVPIGLPLAFTPLLAWVFAVYRLHPDAFAIWKYEILDRISGSGDHPQPIWYYIPVFLAGLAPATMMLMAPSWNFRWKEGWTHVRSATPIALWALAVVVPVVMFSLISGKLTTYMLPMAAPLALLTALMLEEWMAGRADHRAAGRRWPDVVITHTLVTTVAVTGAIVAAAMVNKPLIPAALGLIVIPVASTVAWLYWKRTPKRRPVLLALMWSAWVAVYGWGALVENNLRTTTDPRNLIATVKAVAADHGMGLAKVVFYGYYDPAFGFYTDHEYVVVGSAEQLGELADEHGSDGLIILVDRRTWNVLISQAPEMQSRFTIEIQTLRWVNRELLILSLNPPAVAPGQGDIHDPA